MSNEWSGRSLDHEQRHRAARHGAKRVELRSEWIVGEMFIERGGLVFIGSPLKLWQQMRKGRRRKPQGRDDPLASR